MIAFIRFATLPADHFVPASRVEVARHVAILLINDAIHFQ
jgi:hypothetical protein